jgi:DNA-binding NarL/FixJ family response regulator
MQNHVKYLVVDDSPDWANHVDEAVREYFEGSKKLSHQRVRSSTAYNAKQAEERISEGGWDLVMLDMSLGDGAGKQRVSGLDLLAEIAQGNKNGENKAYFVVIVTGAVTDPTLEKVYGKDAAALLRYGALNEAVRLMPASRVRILHKPEGLSPDKAMKVLQPHLQSALDQYCSVSIERNIFRPLPKNPGLWEVCFNGGPRITLKHASPYDMIRSALAQPGRELKIIELIHALANSSGKKGAVILDEDRKSKPSKKPISQSSSLRDEFEDGLDGSELGGFGGGAGVAVDGNDGAINLDTLLGGLLRALDRDLPLKVVLAEYSKSYGEEVLLTLPSRANHHLQNINQASETFGIPDVGSELVLLIKSLKPILVPIRERWLAKKEEAKKSGVKSDPVGGRVRVARGVDNAELALARQHWLRFKQYIGRRPALKEFGEHVISWVDRNPTTKGHLFYRPKDGGNFYPFWLTE